MNVLLIAAFENDVHAIQMNIENIDESQRFLLMTEATKNKSMDVVKYLDDGYCDYSKLIETALKYDAYNIITYFLKKEIFWDVDKILMKNSDMRILNFLFPKKANIFAYMFHCVKYFENIIFKKLYRHFIQPDSRTNHIMFAMFCIKQNWELALYVQEHAKENVQENARYDSYKKFVANVRNQAATKIYFWWIPICYDLNRACGKRMAEIQWNKYQENYKNIL